MEGEGNVSSFDNMGPTSQAQHGNGRKVYYVGHGGKQHRLGILHGFYQSVVVREIGDEKRGLVSIPVAIVEDHKTGVVYEVYAEAVQFIRKKNR